MGVSKNEVTMKITVTNVSATLEYISKERGITELERLIKTITLMQNVSKA